MIQNLRVLAIIPARGGSKGIPRKNICDLGGMPLIAHSIRVAQQSSYIDEVLVSTDDEEIAMVAQRYGATVLGLRPTALASDQARTIDVLSHELQVAEAKIQKKWDVIVLLQPTQPYRSLSDLDSAIVYWYEKGQVGGVVSLSRRRHSPILMRTMDASGQLSSLLPISSTVRRQDMPEFWRVDGVLYINSRQEILDKVSLNDNRWGYCLRRSLSIDIDTPADLDEARQRWNSWMYK